MNIWCLVSAPLAEMLKNVHRFQFRLRTLLLTAFAACLVAWFGHILAGHVAVGRISDLPVGQRLVLASLASHGIAIVDRFT